MPEATQGGSLKRFGAIAAVVAVGVVAFGIYSRAHSEHELAGWTADQAVPTVGIVRPKAVASGGVLTLPANLQALNSAPIYARTSGYVRQWFVDIGQPVRQGQTLAILDAPEVDQQLAAAQADLQTAKANQQLASTTAERWRTMLTKDAVSKQETDEKIGDLAAKTAVVNAARANVERLRYTLGFTKLIAPFSGVVTTRSTQIGQLVNAGAAGSTPLFTVSDVSRMRIYVRVPQAYSAQIHDGMHITLSLPEYPGRQFDAVMTRNAGAVDPTSGTVLVELQAPNPDRALKPGAYAQANFPLSGESGAVTVPAGALIFNDKGTQIAVLGDDGRAHLKSIKVGRDLGDRIEVQSGLSTQLRVIDSPPDSLQDGDKVRAAAAGSKADAGK